MQENKQLAETSGEKKSDRVQLRSIKNESKPTNADSVDGSGEPVYDMGADITYGFRSPNSSGTISCEDDVLRQRNDELDKLQHELEMTRKEWLAEQQRVSELEEQLIAISECQLGIMYGMIN